jgi:hypothetical protein
MFRLVKRPLAAFLGMWFLLVMIEPESVHSCPVHSATLSGGHPAHTAHHSAAQSHHQSPDKPAAACSCPGDCAASTFNAVPSTADNLVDTSSQFAEAAHVSVESIRVSQPDFFLPFAIGPPAESFA